MMTVAANSDETRTETVLACLLCGTTGRRKHSQVRDHFFLSPGAWDYSVCESCGLVWLGPRPTPDEIGRFYEGTYYTHTDADSGGNGRRGNLRRGLLATVPGYERLAPRRWRSAGYLLRLFPGFRDKALIGVMALTGQARGKLLDVGCGSGEFLALMNSAGWDVAGVEPDPDAAAVAKRRGIDVTNGTLQSASFPSQAFDAVTAAHVLEHVYDPVDLLAECRRVLKPDGRLTVVTPNAGSLAHRWFGKDWFGLEPPRHLHLFTLHALEHCARRAGLEVLQLRTSAQSAAFMWSTSRAIRSNRETPSLSMSKLPGMPFHVLEALARHFDKSAGEEILLVARPAV